MGHAHPDLQARMCHFSYQSTPQTLVYPQSLRYRTRPSKRNRSKTEKNEKNKKNVQKREIAEKVIKIAKKSSFGGFMAPTAPETPLERLSDANYIGFTKNQPNPLHLRPFRDITTKVCARSDVSELYLCFWSKIFWNCHMGAAEDFKIRGVKKWDS